MTGRLPRPFWTLWAGTLVNRAGSFVVPFLALYLRERGFTPEEMGLVGSLYALGATTSQPIAGVLTDHVGRRATMVGSLLFGGTATIALGFADRLVVIAPTTFAVGFFAGAYHPPVVAALIDLVAPEQRVRAFGLMHWIVNLGFAIGALLGGVIASRSFLALFVADGATTLLFALIIVRGVPETLSPELRAQARREPRARPLAGLLAPFADRVFLCFLLLVFALGVVLFQHQLVLPLDMAAHQVSKATFGAIMGLNGIIIIVLQPPAVRLLSRLDPSRVIAGASVLAGVGYGMNALVQTPALYAAGVAIWTLGEIGSIPISNALVADLAPPVLRGRYQAAYGLAGGFAGFVAPMAGSIVLERLGAPAVWGGCLAVGLAVALGQLALSGALQRARAARSPR